MNGNGGRNSHALRVIRRPVVLELHDVASASELADHRAAASGLQLADFECPHGRLEHEPCPACRRIPRLT